MIENLSDLNKAFQSFHGIMRAHSLSRVGLKHRYYSLVSAKILFKKPSDLYLKLKKQISLLWRNYCNHKLGVTDWGCVISKPKQEMWAVSGNNYLVKELCEQKNSQTTSSRLRCMNSLATEEHYLCIPLPAPAPALKGDGDSCNHLIVPERTHPLRLVREKTTKGAQARVFLGHDLLGPAVRFQWTLCIPSSSGYSIILWCCSCQDSGEGSSCHHW